jgi:alpha-L-fucosidase 2
MNKFFRILLSVSFLFSFSPLLSHAQQQPLRLWYEQPASRWEECVALGNGRLGAMPDGGVLKENITLNDITLWSGGKQDADSPEAAKHLPAIRQLLFEGKNDEAQDLMYKSFVCKGAGSGQGNGAKVPYGSYEVLGNLHLDYNYGIDTASAKPSKYMRELSLEEAIARTSYTLAGTVYTREYFTSFDTDVLIIRLTADKIKKINIALSIDRPEQFKTAVEGDELQMTGQLENGTNGKGMQYITRIRIKSEGGKLTAGKGALQVKDANAVTIYLAASTDYRNPDFKNQSAKNLTSAMHQKYSAAKHVHVQKYQQLFNRAKLSLGNDDKKSLPTDKRLVAFAADSNDPGLAALYYQFGRYLLICSTRPGLLPPNLQGLWANTINTPWNGDYHLNINIQMNHWPLNVTNLPMLNEPFYSLVANMVEPGTKTAKVYYDAEGWVAHVITNVWGYTSPGEHPSWGSFNTGSAWLCQMLWTHYIYTQDKIYLSKIYTILKGSADFYLATLVKDPTTGWLVTAPSNSPENTFILPSGKMANVCVAPTMDNQLIRALFGYVIQASGELNTDEALRKKLQEAIQKLPPNQIGKDGRLMEWLQEYTEPDPEHRHVSHLWALYPGNEITPEKTPDLAKAARASLEKRGDQGTGWSLAWKINLWARLHDGERAYKTLQRFFRPTNVQGFDMHTGGGTYSNLFCAHPPFQIDGNFGTTAGISEMLLQSHNGYVEFLPATPSLWKDGSFSGWCVPGAEVSAAWHNMIVNQVNIYAVTDTKLTIKMPAQVSKAEVLQKGKYIPVQTSGDFFNITLKKGETTTIRFQ